MSKRVGKTEKLGTIYLTDARQAHQKLKDWVRDHQPDLSNKKEVRIPDMPGNTIIFVDKDIPDHIAIQKFKEKLNKPVGNQRHLDKKM